MEKQEIKIKVSGMYSGTRTFVFVVMDYDFKEIAIVTFEGIKDTLEPGVTSYIDNKIYSRVANSYYKRLLKY